MIQPRLSIEQAKAWVAKLYQGIPNVGQREYLAPDYEWKMLSGFPHRIKKYNVVHFVPGQNGQIECRNGYVN
jgi:hypothetical protein